MHKEHENRGLGKFILYMLRHNPKCKEESAGHQTNPGEWLKDYNRKPPAASWGQYYCKAQPRRQHQLFQLCWGLSNPQEKTKRDTRAQSADRRGRASFVMCKTGVARRASADCCGDRSCGCVQRAWGNVWCSLYHGRIIGSPPYPRRVAPDPQITHHTFSYTNIPMIKCTS